MHVETFAGENYMKDCTTVWTEVHWSRGKDVLKRSHSLDIPNESHLKLSPDVIRAEYIGSVMNYMKDYMEDNELFELGELLADNIGPEKYKQIPVKAKKITVTIQGKQQTIDVTDAGVDISSVEDAGGLTKFDWQTIMKTYIQAKQADGEWKEIGFLDGKVVFAPTGGNSSLEVTSKFWEPNKFFQAMEELEEASSRLPGIDSRVRYPCYHGASRPEEEVIAVIAHLNDVCQWPREKIADWLDDLQDNQGYDFTFQVPDEIPEGGK